MTDRERYDSIFEFYLDPRVYERRRSLRHKLYRNHVFRRVVDGFRSLRADYQRVGKTDDAGVPTGRIWAVVGTRNQFHSVEFLAGDPNFNIVNFTYSPNELPTPEWRIRPRIAFLPRYLPYYLRTALRRPRSFFRGLYYLLATAGAYEQCLLTLKHYRPRAVIVANDHVPEYRALVQAANTLGIPTAYIQHASVADDFPSLICTASFLDGEDSLRKYLPAVDAPKNVHLIGIPRFDRFYPLRNTADRVRTLGIAYSLYDDVTTVVQLAGELKRTLPGLQVTLRPHPSDTRSANAKNTPGLAWSDSKTIGGLEFLRGVDALISSESAIHLEATLLNVVSLYYDMTVAPAEVPADVYGYLRKGLVDRVASSPDLIRRLQELSEAKPDVRHRAAYYCATVNTSWDGRSGELFRKIFREQVLQDRFTPANPA